MGRRLLLAFAVIVASAWGAAPMQRSPASDPARIEPARILGISSCSARSCHGADEPLTDPIVRSEYTTWEFLDPHARSYSTLFSAESNKIASLWSRNKDAKAKTEPRCLACHAEPLTEKGSTTYHSVGCESCHGPASQWLNPHTLGSGQRWRDKYVHEGKEFVDVSELPKLAAVCAGCHIGSPTSAIPGVPRDMDHDMIAAGHPPLNFEFAGYLAQLPEHWNVRKHAADKSYFARAWAAGQVASAKAALELLEHRTHQPTWPELSEYACYMCHHDIRGRNDWRQQRPSSPGTPLWGGWHFAALPAIVTDAEANRKIEEFRALMATRPRAETARQAAAGLKPLLSRMAHEPIPTPDRAAVLAALRPAAINDWAGAAQLYLALAALSSDADRQELRKSWEELRRPAEFQNKVGERLQSIGQQGKPP